VSRHAAHGDVVPITRQVRARAVGALYTLRHGETVHGTFETLKDAMEHPLPPLGSRIVQCGVARAKFIELAGTRDVQAGWFFIIEPERVER
jgi:hypothetical protein